MKISFTRLVALLIGLTALGLTAVAEPALVGNKALDGQTLDADGVKAVLLGKKVMLGDTRAIIVIAKTSEAQEAFLKKAVNMSTSQFQNHWRRLFMTGGGSAPKIVETEADACKLVAETAGAIAAADSGSAAGLIVLAK